MLANAYEFQFLCPALVYPSNLVDVLAVRKLLARSRSECIMRMSDIRGEYAVGKKLYSIDKGDLTMASVSN